MRHRILTLLAVNVALVLTGLAAAATASPETLRPRAATHAAAPAPAAAPPAKRPLVRAPAAPKRITAPVKAPTAAPPATPHQVRRAPVAVRREAPVRARAVRAPAPVSLTPQQRLDRAIARIPGYRPTDATWLLQSKDGYWGTADWYRNVIWFSPKVPAHRVYDVAAHEWSHLKSVQPYAGDVNAAVTAMTSYFGGTGLVGAERAADCMARLTGATWTHYTDCNNASWRAGAARLLKGQPL